MSLWQRCKINSKVFLGEKIVTIQQFSSIGYDETFQLFTIVSSVCLQVPIKKDFFWFQAALWLSHPFFIFQGLPWGSDRQLARVCRDRRTDSPRELVCVRYYWKEPANKTPQNPITCHKRWMACLCNCQKELCTGNKPEKSLQRGDAVEQIMVWQRSSCFVLPSLAYWTMQRFK